jgi:protein-S-isoprenylcysteine O-methyltransferase Ste14
MDWLSTIILAAVFTLSILAWRRTIPKRRFVTVIFLLLPVLLLSLRWAAYRQSWPEWWIGFTAAVLISISWWFGFGRKLPSPRDGTQRVWTKDDPFE